MKPINRLIHSARTLDLADFEAQARLAKDAGFTHMDISWLRELTDFRGEDADSPWCQWSKVCPSFFKVVTPPGMEEAYPADFVKRQFDWLQAKHEICRKVGLKAAFYGNEPHWLSERVYAQHPEWRGSRCDNSLRTVGMHFAPNMDHPEVRAVYRQAVKMIAAACPLLDVWFLMDNDSGSGFTWGGRLYVNPNGPIGGDKVDMGKRVLEFVRQLRQGAIEGGIANPYFYQLGWCTPEEERLIKRACEPGIGMYHKLPENPDLHADGGLIGAGTWGGHGSWWPQMEDYPTPFLVINGAVTIKTSTSRSFWTFGDSHRLFPAMKAALAEPAPTCERERLQVASRIAAALFAEDCVDPVVDAWVMMERADAAANAPGLEIRHGLDHLRWLTRPLVAHQELLSEDEMSYWAPYLYQSKKADPDTWLDYVNHSGYPVASNFDVATCGCLALMTAMSWLSQAAAKLEAAMAMTKSEKARAALQLDVFRVKAWRCGFFSMHNNLQMGTLIKLRDEFQRKLAAHGDPMTSASPERPDWPCGNRGSNGLFYMHRALRWELDNMTELIKLMEACPVTLFTTAPRPEMECSFLFSPDLLNQLKRKREIMVKHWRETERGWYRPTLGG
jgi:hypothetical protein